LRDITTGCGEIRASSAAGCLSTPGPRAGCPARGGPASSTGGRASFARADGRPGRSSGPIIRPRGSAGRTTAPRPTDSTHQRGAEDRLISLSGTAIATEQRVGECRGRRKGRKDGQEGQCQKDIPMACHVLLSQPWASCFPFQRHRCRSVLPYRLRPTSPSLDLQAWAVQAQARPTAPQASECQRRCRARNPLNTTVSRELLSIEQD
jgi:hypothetical protein